MKKCFKCGSTKPQTDFYKHPKMRDGRLNKCKACTKNDSKQYRAKNIEIVKEKKRKYSMLPSSIKRRAAYAKTEHGKQVLRRIKKAWIKRNPEKRRAQNRLYKALRSGKIKREGCRECKAKAVAHHEDYTKPLEVVWLCPKHHKARHKEMENENAF